MMDLMMIEDVFAKYIDEIHGIIYPLYEDHTSYLNKCVASGVQNTAALDESHKMKVDRFVQNMNV